MGRIVISVSVQNITNAEQRIRCDTLVDTGASHPVLPSAWRGPPRRSRGTGHGRARAGKSAVDQGCGEEQEVKTNTGRRRVNINGAIDLERLEPVVCFDGSINAKSTIALFEQLEALNLVATWIYVICDNARYYRSKAVQEYLKSSRIKLIFLPPYAPNLNLIERFWKFFKKMTLYNRYYETFDEFRAACEELFTLKNPFWVTLCVTAREFALGALTMKLITTRTSLGLLLLTLALNGCGDQVVVEGINMDTDRPVGSEAAEVEDLGAGSTNDGGTPDFEADLHEAAITDEKNLGPNAPSYIP